MKASIKNIDFFWLHKLPFQFHLNHNIGQSFQKLSLYPLYSLALLIWHGSDMIGCYFLTVCLLSGRLTKYCSDSINQICTMTMCHQNIPPPHCPLSLTVGTVAQVSQAGEHWNKYFIFKQQKTQHVWVLSNLSYFDRISLSLKYFQSVLGKGSHPDLKWNSFWGLFWAFLFLVLLVIVISSFGGIRKTHLIAEREAGFKSLMQVQTFAVAN